MQPLKYTDLLLKELKDAVGIAEIEVITRNFFLKNGRALRYSPIPPSDYKMYTPFGVNYGGNISSDGTRREFDYTSRAFSPIIKAKYGYSWVVPLFLKAFDFTEQYESSAVQYSTSSSPDEFVAITDADIEKYVPTTPLTSLVSAKKYCDFINFLLKLRYFRAYNRRHLSTSIRRA